MGSVIPTRVSKWFFNLRNCITSRQGSEFLVGILISLINVYEKRLLSVWKEAERKSKSRAKFGAQNSIELFMAYKRRSLIKTCNTKSERNENEIWTDDHCRNYPQLHLSCRTHNRSLARWSNRNGRPWQWDRLLWCLRGLLCWWKRSWYLRRVIGSLMVVPEHAQRNRIRRRVHRKSIR